MTQGEAHTDTRTCIQCECELPLTSFSPKHGHCGWEGFNARCKPCRAATERERRARIKEANPDVYKSEDCRRRGQEYREKNRDRVQEQARARYAADPVGHRASVAAYRKRHPDRVKAANARPEAVAARKAYMYRHPEMGAIYSSNYRARKSANGGVHTWQDVLDKMESQGGLCVWCGRDYKDNYEVDHVVPVSKGGSNGAENIAVACFECNRIKHAKRPPETLLLGGSYH